MSIGDKQIALHAYSKKKKPNNYNIIKKKRNKLVK